MRLLLALVVFWTATLQDFAYPEIHLIPAGYVGYITIAFLAANGEPGDFEGNARLYRIPSDGILLTQIPPNIGLGPERQLFTLVANGDRHPITMISGTIHDSPDNRAHPDVEAFYPVRGRVQAGILPCDIEYDQYFVGTRAQLLDRAEADLARANKHLQDTFKCP